MGFGSFSVFSLVWCTIPIFLVSYFLRRFYVVFCVASFEFVSCLVITETDVTIQTFHGISFRVSNGLGTLMYSYSEYSVRADVRRKSSWKAPYGFRPCMCTESSSAEKPHPIWIYPSASRCKIRQCSSICRVSRSKSRDFWWKHICGRNRPW
jgi:hypothetical protein